MSTYVFMHSFWASIESPVLYALPVFLVFIAVEALIYRHETADEGRDAAETGYLAVDARTSMSMGAGSIFVLALAKAATLGLFVLLWVHVAPWHVPMDTWWGWLLLALAVDLDWYLTHRFSHRVRIAWAAHQAHHSSEYFNFGTALRQKWNPWAEMLFWSPLPVLGFAPWTIFVMFGANLVYQFFVHTERVTRLWGPIEFVFNTPSHHRVHHASDKIYLDRNYGGILIIWDRLFGTFQKELHRPTYGLTKPVESYNLLHLQYREYASIVRDVRASRTWRERWGYLFGPPGWSPGWSPATRSGQRDGASEVSVSPISADASAGR